MKIFPWSDGMEVFMRFGTGLLLLAIVAIAGYQTISGLVTTGGQVEQLHSLLRETAMVLQDTLNLETGARGYALTGDPDYLQPYQVAKGRLLNEMETIGTLISPDPKQRIQWAYLRSLVEQRIELAKQLIDEHAAEEKPRLSPILQEGSGLRLQDEIRRVVAEMERQEREELRIRKLAQAKEVGAARLTIAMALLAGLLAIPMASYVTTREIRRRGQAEKALRESERYAQEQSRLLQSVLNGIGEGVVGADRSGHFLIFNPAAERILGTGKQDVGLKQWSATYHAFLSDGETPHPPENLPLARAIRGEAVEATEMIIRKPPAGTPIWLEVSGWPLRDETDGLCGGVVVFRDATQARDARAALLKSKDEAEKANRLKDQFLSTVNHELRTPLNAVLGFAQILADQRHGSLNEKQCLYLKNIHDGGRHLLHLINDILDLSRIEAGRFELNMETFPARLLLAEISDPLMILAEKKGQTLAIVAEPELLLRGDRKRLSQVLLNLGGNAVKFTPEGKAIEILAQATSSPGAESGTARIEVRDSGPGIPLEEQAQIFESFSQGSVAEGRQEGTGLGLAISKRLVEMHGSRLLLESAPHKGSRFYFDLPIAPSTPPAKEMPIPQRQAGSGRTRILVIDDDPVAASLIEAHLKSSERFEVACCCRPGDALEYVRQFSPDIITLDLLMPGPNGWQILQQLQHDPQTASLPVIMLTIVDQPELGLALGASEYLVKPVEASSLLGAVQRCMKGSADARSVLIVEDDPSSRHLLENQLQGAGYKVVVAADGIEARRWVALQKPGLVVLDLLLPGMGGIELLKEWRGQAGTADLPVVILTGKELSEEEQRFLEKQKVTLFRKSHDWRPRLLEEIHRVLCENVGAAQ